MADEFYDRRDPESDSGRFELGEGGITSFADYRLAGDTLVIEHVETPPAARGTGAAGRLMAAIVARARASDVEIIAECGYAAAWLERRRTSDTPSPCDPPATFSAVPPAPSDPEKKGPPLAERPFALLRPG